MSILSDIGGFVKGVFYAPSNLDTLASAAKHGVAEIQQTLPFIKGGIF